jgi:WD40 repeat protein
VQLADGRQTPIAAHPRPPQSFGFQALPDGAAQLWADGVVTLVDDAGTTVDELDVPQEVVRDIAVSPDGRWAVTAGYGGDLFRWDVDPATGVWSGRERFAGHSGDLVGVEVEQSGRHIVTVSVDHTIILWDMAADGGRAMRDTAGPEDRFDAACAIVARDLSRDEWRRYLPERPWEPTCTDGA